MKLRIKNFRSLSDTKYIEIKPITILIGKNSSGKSSFLRTFPMLRQSTEERTKSPILLYGSYVDFGSYKDIRPHSFNEGENYELGFALKVSKLRPLSRMFGTSRSRNSQYEVVDELIEFNLKFEENDKELIQISEQSCNFFGNSITIALDRKKNLSSSIIVNGRNHFKPDENFRFLDEAGFFVQLYKEKKSETSLVLDRIKETIEKKILGLIGKYCLKSTSDATKWKIIENVSLNCTIGEFLNKLKRIKNPKRWSDSVGSWNEKTEDFLALKDYLALYDFFDSYGSSINLYLNNTFSSIKYIAPLRATAERYYRIQHLAVDEVDSNGKNLPIFLDSLTDAQMHRFQNWTMENFNFKTKISKIEGHYSIKIVQDDNYEINLSDMGFGYSQILPIITQLWFTATRYDRRRQVYYNKKNLENIVVIEQPELHLHPDFQAKFADALAKIIKINSDENYSLSIIVETHSDIIINRLGDSILADKLKPDDINIVVFDKVSERQSTNISIVKYDANGNLTNWPLGFFLPDTLL